MLKVLIGDMFSSQVQTLVNTVNCVGIMGKGVALEFKKRFPAMFKDYESRCDAKLVKPGEPYLFGDSSGKLILNFPTKNHWRSAARIQDIERGLDRFVAQYSEWGITSVAMPPLGCGNGGLEWSEVGPLIYRKLSSLPIDIEVYAPYGTAKHELTEEFLAAPSQMSLEGKGRRNEKLNPNWVTLLEVLRELASQPYANPVGRTIFQKICYVVTEMGVPTGFHFAKGSYGPYSADVKPALHELANRGWLQEAPLGKMVALTVSPQYDADRKKFAPQLELHARKVAKAVDLFSRIKSTEQAEEMLTVLFASRQLKQSRGDKIAERELLDFIMDWKKSWQTDEKKQAVASAIRNMVILGWMRADFSEDLGVEAA